MHRRRWLIVGLCFCVFSGCVSCQSNYDYCGPMPDEGGDFMYRKNSVLGGDPSKPVATGTATGDKADETGAGAEPTPAPPPDEEPMPGMALDESSDETGPETMPGDDGDGQPQAYDEYDDGERGEERIDDELTVDEAADTQPVSTLQWHAPAGTQQPSPIKQVRFR